MRTFIITIIFCLISGQVLCFTVNGCIGGSVVFKCMYKKNNMLDGKVKYFYKNNTNTEVGSTDVQDEWVHKGRLSLYDDKNGGFFRVFIRNLSKEDEGKYTCGQHQSWSRKVELKLSNDACCITSVFLTGYLGQTVTFNCEYPHSFKNLTKVFYRLDRGPVHVSNTSQSSNKLEKFSLDDGHEDYFKVTIRNQTVNDGGMYLCGVERHQSKTPPSQTSITHISFIKEIHLNVSVPPVIGHEGNSSYIRSPYNPNHTKEVHLLRKGKSSSEEARTIIQTDEDHLKKPNILLKNDAINNLFTVTITNLTAEDAGIYWCAVQNSLNYISTELMIVTRDVVTHSQISGGSASINCKYTRTSSHHERFFCKGHQPSNCVRDGVQVSSARSSNGRFSLNDKPSDGVFTVNITDLRVKDSGIYWCGEERSGSFILTQVQLNVNRGINSSDTKTETILEREQPGFFVIFAVSGGFILLAVGLVLLFKWRCNRNGIHSSTNRGDKQTNDMVPNAVDEYEEIKDGRRDSASTTVQFPSNSSDELQYAAVRFNKHEDSVTDDTLTFSKEEIHTDYAAVSHRPMQN